MRIESSVRVRQHDDIDSVVAIRQVARAEYTMEMAGDAAG